MLTYFPAIYPDELLYSVLARYHRHTGARSDAQTMEALFGRRTVVANIDLPGALNCLAERIPPGRALPVDRILDGLTLLPYYVAFQSSEMQAIVRAHMCQGQVDGLHLKLGLAAFRAGRVTRLRFCDACLEEMHERYGEGYWRRAHQLPGVLICASHGIALQESSVFLSGCRRHTFIAPDGTNCPPTARPLVSDVSLLPVLRRLARASAALLDGGSTARSPEAWTAHYRMWMGSVGLALSSRRMNLADLDHGLRRHFGAALSVCPGVMDGDRFAGDWPAALLHRRNKARHPLFHLLLQDFLAQLSPAPSPAPTPFGVGPWPCRNPLHRHVRPGCVTLKNVHPSRNHQVGVFACSCGYVYTRSYRAETKEVGPPRFQSFGPSLAPVLRRGLREHRSLRAIGRSLALDPVTVVRLAAAEGIATPWKLRSRDSSPSRQDRPIERLTRYRQVKPSQGTCQQCQRIDWPQRDRILAELVVRAAAQIRAKRPPVRVTPAGIERQLGARGWLEKRRAKLPLTTRRMQQLGESVESFQRRRVAWVSDQISDQGQAPVLWRVMRRSGLTAKHRPMIASVLAQKDLHSGRAS